MRARLATIAWRLAIEALVAAACFTLTAVARLAIEALLPMAAPFALAFPAILLATVLAGWRSGVMALALIELGVWYAVIPPRFEFGPLSPEDAGNLVMNGLSGLLVVMVAQGFRTASQRAERERSEKLEARDLLLRELDHRMKNNFQMVAGLLDMQRRTAKEPATAEALEGVIVRVHSLAQAHAALYAPAGDMRTIDFARYVQELCRSLSDSLLLTTIVQLKCVCEPAPMATDRAAALGLVINELVTNAVKHAFPDGRSGVIQVTFARTASGWRLTVADDGVGMPPEKKINRGLGRRLVDAFARQAGGTLSQGTGPGAAFVVDLPH
jgi:two-component sensor histidine kinase